MGFCTLCNQNYYSSVACPKCHRSSPSDNSSRISSLFANRKGLNNNNNTDKWQDTYSKKGIFSNNPMPSFSTPRPRQSPQRMTMPKFTREEKDDKSKENSNLKSCAYCHKKQNSWSDFNHFTIYKSVYYCKPCLEEKLNCPKCHVKVKLLDSQVDYNNHAWHTGCFTCHYCSSQLKEVLAAQDSEGNPCCRSCHVSRKQPSPESISASTPLLSSSRSALTSAYFTRRGRPLSALVNHVIEDGANSIKQVLEEKPAEQTSPKPYKNATEKPEQIVEPTKKQTTKAASSITPSQDTLEPKKTQRRKKLVVKKPCKECGQHVSKKDYRGLKTITGEVLCYHAYCLFCAKCHQSFTDLEFCTDGKHFYHTKCPEAMIGRANNNTSPQSEEEEPFPKTPTFPSADAHFDVLSSSPTNLDLLPIRKEDDDLTKKPNTTVEITCNTCSRPVTDTFLELANHFYHKECLLCAGCQKTVPTNRKLFRYQDRLYCDGCSVKNNLELKKKKETVNSDLRVTLNSDIIKKSNSTTSPSDIFKSRKKSLPRLGGVRTCARCNESMPFLDTHPGPNATRWHKKCLRCSGCNKQMDSDAHMTINESTGLCLVHCRECLDDTPKPKFVR